MHKCELCGSLMPKYRCAQCNNQLLCASCDDMYHRHPKRKTHSREVTQIEHYEFAIYMETLFLDFPKPIAEHSSATSAQRRDHRSRSAASSQIEECSGLAVSRPQGSPAGTLVCHLLNHNLPIPNMHTNTSHTNE